MKRLSVFAVLIIVLSLVTFNESARAADMSVGISSWYSEWHVKQKDNGSEMDNDFGYGLFLGPVLSIKLSRDFSLSMVYLYAKYDTEVDFGSGGKTPYTAKRHDSDVLLNYALGPYFKIFAGAKYLGFQWDAGGSGGAYYSYGPGLGLGGIFPIVSNLYLLGNVSGIYLTGKVKPDVTSGQTGMKNSDVAGYGINTNASIAYYISAASTTLSAGYRYQYFYNEYDSMGLKQKFNFKGVTFSAIYSFDL
jgi:hypothetical protein